MEGKEGENDKNTDKKNKAGLEFGPSSVAKGEESSSISFSKTDKPAPKTTDIKKAFDEHDVEGIEKLISSIGKYYQAMELFGKRDSLIFDISAIAKRKEEIFRVDKKTDVYFPEMRYYNFGTLVADILPEKSLGEITSSLKSGLVQVPFSEGKLEINLGDETSDKLKTTIDSVMHGFSQEADSLIDVLTNIKSECLAYAEKASALYAEIISTIGESTGLFDEFPSINDYLNQLFELEKESGIVKTAVEVDTGYLYDFASKIYEAVSEFRKQIIKGIGREPAGQEGYDKQVEFGEEMATPEQIASTTGKLALQCKINLLEDLYQSLEDTLATVKRSDMKYKGQLNLDSTTLVVLSMKYQPAAE